MMPPSPDAVEGVRWVCEDPQKGTVLSANPRRGSIGDVQFNENDEWPTTRCYTMVQPLAQIDGEETDPLSSGTANAPDHASRPCENVRQRDGCDRPGA